jgi:hypothetical protein
MGGGNEVTLKHYLINPTVMRLPRHSVGTNVYTSSVPDIFSPRMEGGGGENSQVVPSSLSSPNAEKRHLQAHRELFQDVSSAMTKLPCRQISRCRFNTRTIRENMGKEKERKNKIGQLCAKFTHRLSRNHKSAAPGQLSKPHVELSEPRRHELCGV